MAKYEHLPIFRAAFDLALHFEKIIRNFSRYHRYTLGTELRNRSRAVMELVIVANNTVAREPQLLMLRQEIEGLKMLARLCHESGGFASTRSYLYVAEQIVQLAKQNEGWLRYTTGKEKPGSGRRVRRRSSRSGETGHGQNRES